MVGPVKDCGWSCWRVLWLDYSKMTVFEFQRRYFNLASKDIVAQNGDIAFLVYFVSPESPLDKTVMLNDS